MDQSIGSITTEDLDAIKKMFDGAIQEVVEDNPNTNINAGKIIDQFENEIRKKIEVVYPQSEQNRIQELKDSIEKMESKAQRMKTQLFQHRNRYIEDVRSNIENELKSKIPELMTIDLPESSSLSESDRQKLAMLDDQIATLEQALNEAEKKTKDIAKIQEFCSQTKDSLSSN